MQVLISHERMSRAWVLQFSRWQLLAAIAVLVSLLMLLSGTVYHFIFLKAAREGWPLVSPIVRLVVRDEIAQRDRFMRENLDAIAEKVGEMQAKLVKLEAMRDRVSTLAGVRAEEVRPPPQHRERLGGGRGGPFIPLARGSLDTLRGAIDTLDEQADWHTDLFTLFESRLLQRKLESLMVPSSRPVDGPVGSGFGFRIDPISGRAALHTGLDFPAENGTPIRAAAGGVVMVNEWHPAYGQVVEIDHGNSLVTRYAHASRVIVPLGAVVKRGQLIAEVGSSGRSTGSHLHFEVLLDAVPQDPARFLENAAPMREFAERVGVRR
jgi:murein DD-endopeptidase MepM/ murein hydrolase activator NlpD